MVSSFSMNTVRPGTGLMPSFTIAARRVRQFGYFRLSFTRSMSRISVSLQSSSSRRAPRLAFNADLAPCDNRRHISSPSRFIAGHFVRLSRPLASTTCEPRL